MVDYPKEWEEIKLVDIPIQIKKGDLITKKEIANGKIPVIAGGKSPAYYCNRYNREGTTITVSASGANAGYVNLFYGQIFASDCSTIEEDRGYCIEYIYYLMTKEQENIYKLQTGGAQPHVHPKDIEKLEIIYSRNIEEQKAIAETLMAFDRHIENLESLIEKKKMIRDGAVEDLMTGKTRLDGFEDEWEEVGFNDVIVPKARIGWQGLKKDEYLQSGYSYLISGTDFNQGTISFSKISYVTKERYDLDINIQVNSGDVLVTKDGTIGKVAIVPRIDRKATLNSGVFVFKTNKKLTRNFLYWILRSSIFAKFIDDLSAGSTIKHLYQKDLKKFSFYIPKDMSEQKAISSILKSLDDDLQNLEKEKAKVEKIKAGAMDDLLTGRVRLI
ncbi:restriction endonuclease subunit S [Eremococcus coleocola]|uniref:restriction endonuclease subunit S n=1 Tax=Eremococcus coleocola TaxID=88132 RepID=UPI0004231607|nr:restriction endonuclease subunit S [Eremococcus coleocola]